MRELCILLLIVLTIACGVAIQGRIDVGEHAAEPAPRALVWWSNAL